MLPWLVSLLFFQATGQMGVKKFSRYPGYAGPYNLSGSIEIAAAGKNRYSLRANVSGAVPNASHGIHIHSGVSCASANLVGGHFWSPFTGPDPWVPITMGADAAGVISSTLSVDPGYDSSFLFGHTMVIHDPQGARIACGLIEVDGTNIVWKSANLDIYPGYNGTLNASGGTVDVWDLDSVTQIVNFRLAGLEPNATGGVHIHEGLTCANSSAHYWTPSTDPDPWTTTYASNDKGVAEGAFSVRSGYLLSSNIFHAIVIHDSTNKRIACGLLGLKCPSAAIQGVFSACKARDFNATFCAQSCSTSLINMTSAFKSANFTLAQAGSCIDSTAATFPWAGGDSESLKLRVNFNNVPICNVSSTPSGALATAAVHGGAALASALATLFLL